jgi:pantoate--beta-alanine ligase
VALVRCSTIAELRAILDRRRAAGARVGLVPTMGALHAGHASLIERAATGNEVVVTTVFVNPLQFAPTEDLEKYPRTLDDDAALAQAAGATHLFAPSVAEMYPFGPADVWTNVSVRTITDTLDGVHRPGHFDGVATVVAKLFAIAGTCRAYFGEKDFQQLAVIRRMALDLSFPVEVIGCPTVREANGLAMSSRNRYLTDEERARASVIVAALRAGAEAVEYDGVREAATVRARMRAVLGAEPVIASVDYAEVVDAATLQVPETLAGELRLLIAARVGAARLIDNLGAVVPT